MTSSEILEVPSEDWASPLVSPASCSLSASWIGKSSVMVESPSPDPMLISYPPQSDSSSDSSTLSGWVGTSSLSMSLAGFALGLCFGFGFLGDCVGLSQMKPIGSRRFRWGVLVRHSLFSFLTLNTGIPSLGWLKTTYGSCSHLSANLRFPSRLSTFTSTRSPT